MWIHASEKEAAKTRAYVWSSFRDLFSVHVALGLGYGPWLRKAAFGSVTAVTVESPEVMVLLGDWQGTYLAVHHLYSGRVLHVERTRMVLKKGHCFGDVKVYLMGLMKKYREGKPVGSVSKAAADDVVGEGRPVLAQFLTEKLWDDGTPRQTSTLTLFCEDGTIKGSLNDRDTGRVLWASARDLGGLLDVMEELLNVENTPWREGTKRAGKDKRS